jgi:hypothetical protein
MLLKARPQMVPKEATRESVKAIERQRGVWVRISQPPKHVLEIDLADIHG